MSQDNTITVINVYNRSTVLEKCYYLIRNEIFEHLNGYLYPNLVWNIIFIVLIVLPVEVCLGFYKILVCE